MTARSTAKIPVPMEYFHTSTRYASVNEKASSDICGSRLAMRAAVFEPSEGSDALG